MSGHSEDLIQQQNSPDAPLDMLQKPFLPDVLVRKGARDPGSEDGLGPGRKTGIQAATHAAREIMMR